MTRRPGLWNYDEHLVQLTKGGMNTKLHAATDVDGRPLSFFITAAQVSDCTSAAALLENLPRAKWMLADRSYDVDWLSDALEQKGIKPCVPDRKFHSLSVEYDKRRNRSEIIFGRLKDWRRLAT